MSVVWVATAMCSLNKQSRRLHDTCSALTAHSASWRCCTWKLTVETDAAHAEIADVSAMFCGSSVALVLRRALCNAASGNCPALFYLCWSHTLERRSCRHCHVRSRSSIPTVPQRDAVLQSHPLHDVCWIGDRSFVFVKSNRRSNDVGGEKTYYYNGSCDIYIKTQSSKFQGMGATLIQVMADGHLVSAQL